MNLIRGYGKLLEEKPIITKSITSFITCGLGDILCQYLEKKYSKKKDYDGIRVLRQSTVGLLIGPTLHVHFTLLMPWLFPNSTKFKAAKMVLFDQTIGASVIISLFFLYADLLSGKSFDQFTNEMKVKLIPTLYANWIIWPAAQFINFNFVPLHWRVLYTNFVGLFWNSYLSYVQNVRNNIKH